MYKSDLSISNRILSQSRTVSCITHVLVWLGRFHIGTWGNSKQKEAATNAKIVDLFKEALDEIKNCRTEQRRVEFHIPLVCVIPPREAQDIKNGWIKPICVVEGCTHTKQTFWTEDEFTVTSSSGIRNRDVRVAEIVGVLDTSGC
jgi:hypothetical protein